MIIYSSSRGQIHKEEYRGKSPLWPSKSLAQIFFKNKTRLMDREWFYDTHNKFKCAEEEDAKWKRATDFDRDDKQLESNWIENLTNSWLLFWREIYYLN